MRRPFFSGDVIIIEEISPYDFIVRHSSLTDSPPVAQLTEPEPQKRFEDHKFDLDIEFWSVKEMNRGRTDFVAKGDDFYEVVGSLIIQDNHSQKIACAVCLEQKDVKPAFAAMLESLRDNLKSLLARLDEKVLEEDYSDF